MNGPWSRGRHARWRLSPRQVFLTFFALTFIAMGCWAFASPLVAAPDEQAHMIRAYAIDHGQLGHDAGVFNLSLVDVTVPASINFSKAYPRCFQFKGLISARCAPAWSTSTTMVDTTTYVGHYPPLYYMLVGVGSYVSVQKSGLYWMRLASSLVCALMVAMSAYVIARWSRRRVVAAGVALSLTPMVWFLAASVNPSGFEIVTAICLWTALSVFVVDHPDNPPRALVAIIAASASVLVLVRGLSPLFVAIIGVVVGVVIGPSALMRLWRQRRDVKIAVAAVVAAAGAAAAWIFTQGTLNIAPDGVKVDSGTGELTIINLVVHRIPLWLHESVGILGWLDTPMPHWFYDLWYVMVAVLFVGGLVAAAWRSKAALVAVAVLCVLVPVVLVTKQVHQIGIVWQGRDSMPLTVGVPILGAALWARSRSARSGPRLTAAAMVVLVTLLTFGGFYLNLRRYAVGRAGSRLFFLHSGGWSPPTGSLATLLVYGVVTVVLGALTLAYLLNTRAKDDAFTLT